MKKKNKPSKKQAHRSIGQRRQRQSARQSEERLWREMEPYIEDYDLDDEEEWYEFAAHAMHDAAALYEEPEFEGILFEPAEALHTLLSMYNLYVPPPELFEQLSEEEKEESASNAYLRSVADFITEELQRDMLSLLVKCRQRLKRENQTDKLALAAAVEMILRSDSRSEIWSACGIFHRILQASADLATKLEEEKAAALQKAQAIQPDIEDMYDLEEGSAAAEAFWDAVEENPELLDYVESQLELADDMLIEQRQVDSDLAAELLDPDEIDQFFEDLISNIQEQGVDLQTPEPQVDPATRNLLNQRLPDLIKAHFSAERFEEIIEDLQDIIETEEDGSQVQRARVLYLAFSDKKVPYWENVIFTQFLFNILLTAAFEDMDEFEDEEDWDEEDWDEDEFEDKE